MFTAHEKEMLVDALNMALASNKRMQNSKPQFRQMFDQIATDLNNLLNKVRNIKDTK